MDILDFFFPKKCVGCGKFGDYICKDCLVAIWEPEPGPVPAGLDGLTCLWAYDGLVKKIIKNAKYNGRFDALRFLIQNAKYEVKNDLLIVPVPLHKNRLRERGFNQSLIIAKTVSEIWHLELNDCLIRVKDTGHQTLRNRNERLMAPKNAFVVSTKIQDLPSRILLVDDVMTTGATLSECARTLKKAGVKKVWGLVLAR